MRTNPIIIVAGEPYSIFLEIFFKSLKKKKIKNLKNPIVLICSKELLIKQMQKLKYNYKINDVLLKDFKKKNINNKKINIINVDFKFNKIFDKISYKSESYLKNCFDIAISIIKNTNIKAIINGPISKKYFLKKRFSGMTEYFAKRSNSKGKEVMLIYNDKLSVSPLTTHLPLKKIFKEITQKKIIKNIMTINNFFKLHLKKKVRIGITGLNPHCESTEKISEEKKILEPAIIKLKKIGIKISGPFPADTIFMKKNLKRYNLIIGMYHDQVLTPIKILHEFDAINITLGLPFLRITPDHGTNNQMLGKNLSNPTSLIKAILFTKKIK